MLDSHFRTLNGFLTLIEKDWFDFWICSGFHSFLPFDYLLILTRIEFGHKFGDRCGQFYPQKKSEISPVWIQVLLSLI